MTQQQIIEGIKQLSVAECVTLLEVISRRLREEMSVGGNGGKLTSVPTDPAGEAPDDTPLSRQLHGVLKFDGGPPNDEGVKDIISDYLLEKYS